MLIGAVVFLTHGILEDRAYREAKEQAVSVAATVEQCEKVTYTETDIDMDDLPRNRKKTRYDITATYTYDGAAYQTEFSRESALAVGEEVPLLIDPANPEYIFRGSSGALSIVTGLVCLIAFVFAAFLLLFRADSFWILFLVGAIGFFVGGIWAFSVGETLLGVVFAVISAPIFGGVSYLFYRMMFRFRDEETDEEHAKLEECDGWRCGGCGAVVPHEKTRCQCGFKRQYHGAKESRGKGRKA